jgi:hypothetical protein
VHHPIYRETYTLTSLCEDALRAGSLGFWDALAAITTLSRTGGEVDALRVFPLNGHLFSKQAAPSLESDRRPCGPTPRSRARDQALRETLLALGTRTERAGRLPLHYGDFGVEQLGAVYERVLDLDPDSIGTTQPVPVPGSRHSALRKDTGTFYTPQSIADLTIRRTLGPLVEGASADHLLTLRIVDPAMGSGAFLVAALQYLSAAYERALISEGRYAPLEIDDHMRARFRRVIAQRCLYGVDNNPVAVQVARLSVWLATLAHGKPLGFLDHRLRVGNSLIGTAPDVIRRPVGATTHALPLFDGLDEQLQHSLRGLTTPLCAMALRPDESIDIVRRKEQEWRRLVAHDGPASRWQVAMHLWCAPWFWPDTSRPPGPAELAAAIDSLLHDRDGLGGGHVERWRQIAHERATEHHFFHWPMEFADVFYDESGQPRSDAGFDAVIGNPPWEMLRRDPHSRRQGQERDPLVRFIRESGLFPLCRRGQVNLYQPFVDRALQLTTRRGRVGLVLPWGMAVDDGAAELRKAVTDTGALETVVGFDNSRGLFPIHRGVRFAIVVVGSPGPAGSTANATRARFGVTTTDEADAIPESGAPEETETLPLRLSREVMITLGGPTRRWLDLRHPSDLAWLTQVRRFPALGSPEGWHVSFSRELNASDDKHLFRDRSAGHKGHLVVEGKHIGPFTFDRHGPTMVIGHEALVSRQPDGRYAHARLAYRDVSAVGNTNALVAAIIPANVVTTHTLFCLRAKLPIEQQHFLCGLFNSEVFDRLVRLEMGSHVTTTLVENLPVPPWTGSPVQREIAAIAKDLATSALRDSGTSGLRTRLRVLVHTLYALPLPAL